MPVLKTTQVHSTFFNADVGVGKPTIGDLVNDQIDMLMKSDVIVTELTITFDPDEWMRLANQTGAPSIKEMIGSLPVPPAPKPKIKPSHFGNMHRDEDR